MFCQFANTVAFIKEILGVQVYSAEVSLVVLSERSLSKQHFIEDDAQRPNIHLIGDHWIVLNEGLRRKVVVSPNALRGQGHFGVLTVEDLADAEV